ncbi:MAG TPA: hypothetical protein VNI57_03930 [Candidatus Saccharimonadales bacterium]|nr:hypothetical protein [Candidatus Saccharimonadales bacterium]
MARTAARMVVALLCLLAPPTALAENVDPQGDGSRYAWSENAGWINAEPLGEGGPGMVVGSAGLTGWMWGENAGWISLSCENTSSCGLTSYGVVNDGNGELSGRAWGENTGWISFSCSSPSLCDPYGVVIDPSTGVFSGRAWAENIGWISFSGAPPSAWSVRTSWRPATQGGRKPSPRPPRYRPASDP